MYKPVVGAEVRPVEFTTNSGIITCSCWDNAGHSRPGLLRQNFFFDAKCAIILFDVRNRTSFEHVLLWIQDIEKFNGNIPLVVCGNKIDAFSSRVVSAGEIIDAFKVRNSIEYFEISAHANYNIEKPFVYLLKHVQPNAVVIESPALLNPTCLLPDEALHFPT